MKHFKDVDVAEIVKAELDITRQQIENYEHYDEDSVSNHIITKAFVQLNLAQPSEQDIQDYKEKTKNLAASFRPGVSKKEHRWNRFFTTLRYLNHAQQLFSLGVAILGSLFDLKRRSSLIGLIILLGTLAEVNMWFGHLYFPKPWRRMPLWSFSFVIGRFFSRHNLLNGLCSVVAVTLIASSIFFPQILPFGFVALLLVCLIDNWRILYLNYWLLLLFALLWPGSVELSVCFVLGILYFFSGFFKLASPLFYKHTSSFVFGPIFRLLRIGGRNDVISGLGVLGEMVMGAFVVFSPFLPTWVRSMVVWFNLSLHIYIIVFIGLLNGIQTFICWNAMCAALVSLTLSSKFTHASFSALPHIPILLIMLYFPLLQLLGKNEYTTLSHAYFVPGAAPVTYLLFNRTKLENFPIRENGHFVPLFLCGSTIHARIKGTFDTKKIAKYLKCEVDELCILKGDYVDYVLKLDLLDPCNETFGAGPSSFWKCLAREVVQDRCVIVKQGCIDILGNVWDEVEEI